MKNKFYYGLRKVMRFISIYGFLRTIYKILGRTRISGILGILNLFCFKKDIGIIGCGQFGFATIGFFVSIYTRHGFIRCFDINNENQETFEKFYGCKKNSSHIDVVSDQEIKYVYVSSNHSSHTKYAIEAIEAGKVVYIEKPISVSYSQLIDLHNKIIEENGKIYCGYNRPHSKAIEIIRQQTLDFNQPISVSFFISGHVLDSKHWYRNPEEGTRVCGNLGHWLDLIVHMLSWGNLPDEWTIYIVASNSKQRDEDVIINMVSKRGDLVNIVLTARTEPFEGINESINIQWDNLIAKIDDFRKLNIWQNEKKITKRFWPKDVGHKKAILQPFSQTSRNWQEIELSTLLMLHIKEMVVDGVSSSHFSFSKSYNVVFNK